MQPRRPSLALTLLLLSLCAGAASGQDGQLALAIDDARGERGGIVELVLRAASPRPMGQGQMCITVVRKRDRLLAGSRPLGTIRVASPGSSPVTVPGDGPFAEFLGASVNSLVGDASIEVGFEDSTAGQRMLVRFEADSATINAVEGPLAVLRFRLRQTLDVGWVFDTAIEVANTAASGPEGAIPLTVLPGELRIVSGQGALPPGGRIRLTHRQFDAAENGDAVVTVERLGGSRGAVSVLLGTSVDGGATSADPGLDYEPAAATLSWGDKETGVRSLAIPLIWDDLAEPTERFAVRLEGLSGNALLDEDRFEASVLIRDVAQPTAGPSTLRFARSRVAVGEDASSVVLRVHRGGDTTGPVTATWSARPLSAGPGDFVPASGSLSWSAGDAEPRLIPIELLPDNRTEDNETFEVVLDGANGASLPADGRRVRVELVDDDARPAGDCEADDGTLCLLDGRFRATVVYRSPDGSSGRGRAVASTDSTGTFWFFRADNVELLLKVLDACALPSFESYWVFLAGTTNVDFTVSVVDTVTGVRREYSNPQGTPSVPIQDTLAFRTCPAD